MRKIRTITVYATDAIEAVTSLDHVNDRWVSRLANVRVNYVTTDTSLVSVASIDEAYAVDTDTAATLVCSPKELMYIGDSDRVENLFKHVHTGKSGFCAEGIDADGYRRAFWVAQNDPQLYRKVLAFIKGEELPEEPTSEEESSEEFPAELCGASSLEELYRMTSEPADKPADEPVEPTSKPDPKKPADK